LFGTIKKRSDIKLYVRRVPNRDDCDELAPEYLNMVRGAADPEDLPSNTSHETLQQSMVLRAIKTCPAKKHRKR